MLPTNNSLLSRIKDRNIAMNWLLETFPKAFDLRNRKPLKGNIMEDVFEKQLANQPSPHALNDAFHYYTLWGSYLNALTQGAPTINLEGIICGKITNEEAKRAAEYLKAAEKRISGE